MAWQRDWPTPPSTLRDYHHLLRDPGVKYKRGDGVTAGRIMAQFGDRAYDTVTATEISAFLRRLALMAGSAAELLLADEDGTVQSVGGPVGCEFTTAFAAGCLGAAREIGLNPVSQGGRQEVDRRDLPSVRSEPEHVGAMTTSRIKSAPRAQPPT
jgi:hypothetical protein